MNIAMNSTLFFSLFLLAPSIIILLLINNSFNQKETAINNRLQSELDKMFSNFETHNSKLSEEEIKSLIFLYKMKKKYFSLIHHPLFQFCIGILIINLIFTGNGNKINKIDTQKNKDLKTLSRNFYILTVIGVLSHNKVLNKMFLFICNTDSMSLEIDAFSNQNETRKSIQNTFSSFENIPLSKLKKLAFLSLIK